MIVENQEYNPTPLNIISTTFEDVVFMARIIEEGTDEVVEDIMLVPHPHDPERVLFMTAFYCAGPEPVANADDTDWDTFIGGSFHAMLDHPMDGVTVEARQHLASAVYHFVCKMAPQYKLRFEQLHGGWLGIREHQPVTKPWEETRHNLDQIANPDSELTKKHPAVHEAILASRMRNTGNN